MGPAVLITIGVLFLLHEVRGDTFDFSNTYPFILIVIGAVLLASSMAPMTGHVESSSAPPASVPPASTPPATGGPAQSSFPGQGQ
jgi:membrane-bound ClpP family serine protease